jgi:hypothetical protein
MYVWTTGLMKFYEMGLVNGKIGMIAADVCDVD